MKRTKRRRSAFGSLAVALLYLGACAPWSVVIAGSVWAEDGALAEPVYLCADHACGCQSAIDCATDCCCYPAPEIEEEDSCCDDEESAAPIEVLITSASCSLPPATSASITLVDRGVAQVETAVTMIPTEQQMNLTRPASTGEAHDHVPDKVPRAPRALI